MYGETSLWEFFDNILGISNQFNHNNDGVTTGRVFFVYNKVFFNKN